MLKLFFVYFLYIMNESKRAFYMMLTSSVFIIECFVLSVLLSFIFIKTSYKIIGIFILLAIAIILIYPLRYFYKKVLNLIDNQSLY